MGKACLDRSVTLARHSQLNPLASLVQDNPLLLRRDHCSGYRLRFVYRSIRKREQILRWHRQKAAIERLFQITIISAHWVVYCHQIRSSRECSFNLELHERRNNRWQDVTASKHCFSDGHKICDSVVAIANELYFVSVSASRSSRGFDGLLLASCSQ